MYICVGREEGRYKYFVSFVNQVQNSRFDPYFCQEMTNTVPNMLTGRAREDKSISGGIYEQM